MRGYGALTRVGCLERWRAAVDGPIPRPADLIPRLGEVRPHMPESNLPSRLVFRSINSLLGVNSAMSEVLSIPLEASMK